METPSYIKALLIKNGKKPAARRVWSIDLETVWLPFFTATNTVGDTAIPSDALGAPLRLAYNPDGSVKFSSKGRPVTKVASELANNIRVVRENFTAGLQGYARMVIDQNAEGYKTEVEKARQAGEPILTHDKAKLDEAIQKRLEAELAKAKAETEAKAKEPKAKPAEELVPA
jgi:hypothetical protein